MTELKSRYEEIVLSQDEMLRVHYLLVNSNREMGIDFKVSLKAESVGCVRKLRLTATTDMCAQ